MNVITASNVRDALPKAAKYLTQFGKREETRNGPAIVAQRPVTIRYINPKQHVLINPIRDANPFFHIMEAMWMLAGRDDGKFLDHYIKDFSKKFGIGDGTIPDAYGFRWRHGCDFDQLTEIIQLLKKNPTSRQAVLQMWGTSHDFHDLMTLASKPCNLVITFRILNYRLDMAVFNRSNDLIWGCCGANAVHFAILQEYMAGMIGVKMGEYWQISTNLHMYLEHIEMFQKRVKGSEGRPQTFYFLKDSGVYGKTEPLMKYPEVFDSELKETMGIIDDLHENKEVYHGNISNPFFHAVVIPMALAHHSYKKKQIAEALYQMKKVIAQDWKKAGIEWIERRSHGEPT
jgi:thymidylate synthase